MAQFFSFNIAASRLGKGLGDYSTDTLKIALSNTAPTASVTSIAGITEISGGGYVAGGYTITRGSEVDANGVWGQLANNLTLTPSGAAWTFRYMILHNTTKASVIGWWDNVTPINVPDGVPVILSPDPSNGLIGTKKVQ